MMRLVDDYLAVRRAVGFKLQVTESRLRAFVRFATERGDTLIRAETAIAWAGTAKAPQESYQRLGTVVLFARYVRAEDSAHELPPDDVYPPKDHKRIPHIYSDEEIGSILEAAGRLGPPQSSRGDTYRTFLGLLAATGLRVGEARALRLSDLTDDGLVVQNTKFRKSRLVPIHPTTRAALAAYRARWRVIADSDAPLFVSLKGTPLNRSVVSHTFRKIIRELGLRRELPAGSLRRQNPCMTDFRHTFAVRALEACPSAAVGRHMLALSTYLGHGKLSSTYWYLHVTPELMVDIANACEAFRGGGIS
jgi:integrase/recombinase XerD